MIFIICIHGVDITITLFNFIHSLMDSETM